MGAEELAARKQKAKQLVVLDKREVEGIFVFSATPDPAVPRQIGANPFPDTRYGSKIADDLSPEVTSPEDMTVGDSVRCLTRAIMR